MVRRALDAAGSRGRRGRRRRDRLRRRAPAATPARALQTRSSWRWATAAHRRALAVGRRRARTPCSASAVALRQGRRPALRLHLGVDQVRRAVRSGRRRSTTSRAMLEGGEDPRFLARRMVDPRRARTSATPTRRRCRWRSPPPQAVEHVGLPEAQLNLAQARDLPRRWRRSRTRRRARIGAAPRAHRASTAPRCRPPLLRERRLPGREAARPRARLRLPARPPGQINDQEHLPEGLEDLRFYDPRDTEPAMRDRLTAARNARRRDA